MKGYFVFFSSFLFYVLFVVIFVELITSVKLDKVKAILARDMLNDDL